jgi:ankyrin repeat protein
MPFTPLHEAVRRRDLPAIEQLLRSGHDPNALDEKGRPPLWYVFPRDLPGFELEAIVERMIKALLAAGADPAVAGVGRDLYEHASAMISSAGEKNDTLLLASLLGVTPD